MFCGWLDTVYEKLCFVDETCIPSFGGRTQFLLKFKTTFMCILCIFVLRMEVHSVY
jgi:hypothetical protein